MQHPGVQNLWMATPGSKMVADVRAGSWTEGDALCTKDVLYHDFFFQLAGIIPKKLITEMPSSLQSCYKIKQLGTTQVSMAH